MAEMYIRSATEAEVNAALKMRYLGFDDAVVTMGGADGGIDVRASGAVAQVKWKTAQTGRPELQNLYGARGSHYDIRMLFFSASGYSKSAVEYAEEHDMSLFTYEPDGELIPINDLADNMLAWAWGRELERRRPPNPDPLSGERFIVMRHLEKHPEEAHLFDLEKLKPPAT